MYKISDNITEKNINKYKRFELGIIRSSLDLAINYQEHAIYIFRGSDSWFVKCKSNLHDL